MQCEDPVRSSVYTSKPRWTLLRPRVLLPFCPGPRCTPRAEQAPKPRRDWHRTRTFLYRAASRLSVTSPDPSPATPPPPSLSGRSYQGLCACLPWDATYPRGGPVSTVNASKRHDWCTYRLTESTAFLEVPTMTEHPMRRAEDLGPEQPAEGEAAGPTGKAPRRTRRSRDFFRKVKQPLIGLGVAAAAAPMIRAGEQPASPGTDPAEPASTPS